MFTGTARSRRDGARCLTAARCWAAPRPTARATGRSPPVVWPAACIILRHGPPTWPANQSDFRGAGGDDRHHGPGGFGAGSDRGQRQRQSRIATTSPASPRRSSPARPRPARRCNCWKAAPCWAPPRPMAAGNWSITSSVLASGTHNIAARATDAAGQPASRPWRSRSAPRRYDHQLVRHQHSKRGDPHGRQPGIPRRPDSIATT